MDDRKRDFLVCYDYGTGGLWGIMHAHSEEEILATYPELDIAHERPVWMSDARYHQLVDNEWHDITGAPWGILNALLADRERE
jgi:hypothetical protein